MRLIKLMAAVLLVAASAACGSAEPTGEPAVDIDEATAMAENVLAALNDGDYARFSRDWSQAMKEAIPEEGFLGFREELMGTRGRYVAIDEAAMTPAQTEGSMRYEFTTTFEEGPVSVALVIPEDSELIEGVFVEATE